MLLTLHYLRCLGGVVIATKLLGIAVEAHAQS